MKRPPFFIGSSVRPAAADPGEINGRLKIGAPQGALMAPELMASANFSSRSEKS
jgi:hypothetical protein